MICLHHPPLLLDLAPLDAIGLAGSAAMAAIVARHPQVERIIAGHVHMAAQRRFAGSLVQTCPSTQHTMVPDLARPAGLAALSQPPACLLHAWRENTGLITYTSLIDAASPLVELHDGTRWV